MPCQGVSAKDFENLAAAGAPGAPRPPKAAERSRPKPFDLKKSVQKARPEKSFSLSPGVLSVFGYFISANFLKTKESQMAEEPEARSVDETPAQAAKTLSDEAVKLTETKTLPEQQLPGTIQTPAPTEYRNKMQILIVSLIGLLSLVALLVSYSLKNESSGFVSTVSQLRDFVSTCIGFLISYRKNEAA